MTKIRVEYEELWQPWEIGDEARERTGEYEIPTELVERFRAAKEEMEIVWQELRTIIDKADA